MPLTLLCSPGKALPQKETQKTPLWEAVERGDLPAVARLLSEKASVNEREGIAGETPLHLAARKAVAPIAEVLIASGAEVDAKDKYSRTPLHVAAEMGSVEVMKLLLAKGAALEAREDVEGLTPLHRAAICRPIDPEPFRVLLAAGADPNARDGIGETPLHFAARGLGPEVDTSEVVALLLDAGADVNARDRFGLSPLHHAASSANEKVVELLISRGADVNAKDSSGGTPLRRARNSEKEDVIRMLREHGAVE